jgi:hypothetical protein
LFRVTLLGFFGGVLEEKKEKGKKGKKKTLALQINARTDVDETSHHYYNRYRAFSPKKSQVIPG